VKEAVGRAAGGRATSTVETDTVGRVRLALVMVKLDPVPISEVSSCSVDPKTEFCWRGRGSGLPVR